MQWVPEIFSLIFLFSSIQFTIYKVLMELNGTRTPPAETYQILCFFRVQDQDGLFIKADTVWLALHHLPTLPNSSNAEHPIHFNTSFTLQSPSHMYMEQKFPFRHQASSTKLLVILSSFY